MSVIRFRWRQRTRVAVLVLVNLVILTYFGVTYSVSWLNRPRTVEDAIAAFGPPLAVAADVECAQLEWQPGQPALHLREVMPGLPPDRGARQFLLFSESIVPHNQVSLAWKRRNSLGPGEEDMRTLVPRADIVVIEADLHGKIINQRKVPAVRFLFLHLPLADDDFEYEAPTP